MRDMDQKRLLAGDFVCVYGDVVSNIALDVALAEHKARREKDKKAIMTMVLREAGDAHRTKSQSARPVFVVDPTKNRCLHYEQLRPGQRARLNIDGDILADHPELEIRSDLIDCGIDICSPEVLSQYSDNFDWQVPRRGFLYGILKDFELFQLTVHTHIATDGYAARVRSLQAYDAVTRDVVSRWTYPLCPDANLLADQSYQLLKGNVYREEAVVLARSARIDRKTVLGKGTRVGDASVIANSVIGRRCVIGRRVRINGAYIFDDARIGDDSVIENAIIGNEASVGQKCRLEPDTLLSYGVSISDGTTVRRGSRVTRYKRKRADGGSLVQGANDPDAVGKSGRGFHLEPNRDEDDDEPAEGLVVKPLDIQDVDAASISTLNSDEEDDEGDEDEHSHHRHSARADSFGSAGSLGSEESGRGAADFHHEAASSIFDSLQKGDGADSIQLELKALTLSSNADGRQVRRAVALALAKRAAGLVEAGASPQRAVAQTLPPNRLLVERCVLDRGAAVRGEQVEFLLFLQADLVHRAQGSKLLLFACNALAQGELVDDEGLEQWLADPRSSATEELREIRQETEEIIGGESEDEDEDEEDDDDDEV